MLPVLLQRGAGICGSWGSRPHYLVGAAWPMAVVAGGLSVVAGGRFSWARAREVEIVKCYVLKATQMSLKKKTLFRTVTYP